MNFKQWMANEWEGFNFTQEPEMVNGPSFQDKGISSKWKGPGRKKPDPRENEPTPEPMGDKLRKSFGFAKADFLLALGKTMSKK